MSCTSVFTILCIFLYNVFSTCICKQLDDGHLWTKHVVKTLYRNIRRIVETDVQLICSTRPDLNEIGCKSMLVEIVHNSVLRRECVMGLCSSLDSASLLPLAAGIYQRSSTEAYSLPTAPSRSRHYTLIFLKDRSLHVVELWVAIRKPSESPSHICFLSSVSAR
jgi:hypothetical protein